MPPPRNLAAADILCTGGGIGFHRPSITASQDPSSSWRARVGRQPKAVVIALVLQLVVLPAICFGLVVALVVWFFLRTFLVEAFRQPAW